jgi:SPP1 gp7 family putative phage head morphogenesis protein
MADQAHEWTDEQIERLQRRFGRAYSQAAKEMRKKLDEHLSDYEEGNREWRRAVRAGEATEEEYKSWLRSQTMRRDYLVDMTTTLANDAARTNQLAADMINDALPYVYAENANYAAYGIEASLRRNTHAFDLVDQSTIRRLMGLDDDGQIIHEVVPYGPLLPEKERLNLQSLRVEPKKVKDVAWNRQKFNAAIVQSILQGESIPNTAKRLREVLNMDRNMAVRASRTAMTSAENAGRVDSYKRAKRIGIELEQEWLATLDERTRSSHRQLDGTHVPVGEKFGNGLEFPGDPKGPGHEIWNCRCTLVAWFPEDADESLEGRFSRLPDGMTYEQWKDAKEQEKATVDDGNPETLAGVRRGRPMTFDEANELRGNPNFNMADRAGDRYLEANHRVNEYVNEHGYDGSMELQRLRDERDRASREYQTARREQAGYRINCQTCVVANEARRRGYDVQATANTTSSTNARVARHTNLAWIDRATGKHPDYIIYDGEGKEDYAGRPIPTYARYVKWLEGEGTIEEGSRYTIEFWWKGRSSSGHIVSIERTSEGLRMYDPQCGESYDENGIREYLKRVKYKSSIRGTQIADGPQLLKVSNYDFDIDICEQILTEAKHDS